MSKIRHFYRNHISEAGQIRVFHDNSIYNVFRPETQDFRGDYCYSGLSKGFLRVSYLPFFDSGSNKVLYLLFQSLLFGVSVLGFLNQQYFTDAQQTRFIELTLSSSHNVQVPEILPKDVKVGNLLKFLSVVRWTKPLLRN